MRKAKRTRASGKPISPHSQVAEGAGELLDLDQAIAVLKTTRPTFYRWLRGGLVKGMKVGRQWRFRREDLDRFVSGEGPRVDLPVSPEPLERALCDRLSAAGATPAVRSSPEALQRIVWLMLQLARQVRASDLHLLPLQIAGKAVADLRLRIDGILQRQLQFDLRLLPAVIAQWKQLAGCDVNEKRQPQDGRIRREDLPDVCASFIPAHLGESLTARILAIGDVTFELPRYISGKSLEILLKHLAAPSGVIAITGPTGSGKTSTLYSCLKHLTCDDRKLVSIEDPVEYVMPGVLQIGIDPASRLTFASAVRATLRSDADVIMVGEIRDSETARLCMTSAMTGHLVLTTLHTNDTTTALTRLVDIGVEPFVVSDASRLIVSQRLARRLCPHCRKPAQPPTELLARARAAVSAGGLIDSDAEYYEPVGCTQCANTGYRGRVAVYEMLQMTPEIAAALRRAAPVRELRGLAVSQGTVTLAADAVRLAREGVTSLVEALQIAPGD